MDQLREQRDSQSLQWLPAEERTNKPDLPGTQ